MRKPRDPSPSGKSSFWSNLGGVAALLFVITSAALPIYQTFRPLIDDDLDNASHRKGVATIQQIVPPEPDSHGTMQSGHALVEFEGQTYHVHRGEGLLELQAGQPAHINYRVAKSGKVYVDKVEPMPPAKAPEARR
jgi:hypothetical protein